MRSLHTGQWRSPEFTQRVRGWSVLLPEPRGRTRGAPRGPVADRARPRGPGCSDAQKMALPFPGISPLKRGQWSGGSGNRSESIPGRRATGRAEMGARLGASNVFPPTQARAPGGPSKALNQLSLPSLAPILGLGKNADSAEATGLLPGGPNMGFKSSFLLHENFP